MSTGEIITIGLLGFIIYKLFNMPTKTEFDATLSEISTGLTNVADDITRLVEQGQGGDLTEEQETEVFNNLLAVAQRIRDIAAVVPDPPTPEV